MATYYSNNFTTTAGLSATTLEDGFIPYVGDINGRMRTKRMTFIPGAAMSAADVVRMGQFRSTDRLYALYYESADMTGTSTIDIGLYLSGANHDGAVIDDDLFASAIDTSGQAVAYADILTSAALTPTDRGKSLWEQAAVGAASYTTNPNVMFDMTILVNAATASTTAGFALQAIYVAGD